jgi:Terpene cyclase DEP1
MPTKHLIYIAAAVASVIWAWSHAFAWMAGGGNIVNLPSFFIDSYNSGSAAAFLTIDIAVAWGVFRLGWVPARGGCSLAFPSSAPALPSRFISSYANGI